MKSILLVLIMTLCCSCDLNNQKLSLINNSDNTIYYRLLTDTILNKEFHLYKVLPHDTVKPNFVMGGKGAWEYTINTSSKDSSLHIFIFTTEKITDGVIKNKKYRRLDFKVKDLNKIKWKVVYEK